MTCSIGFNEILAHETPWKHKRTTYLSCKIFERSDLICEIFILTFSYTKISPYISQSQNDGEQCIICILAEAVYINKCVYRALKVWNM